MGFIGGNVDPCLHMKKSIKDVEYVGFNIDYKLMMGDHETIDNVVKELQKMGWCSW